MSKNESEFGQMSGLLDYGNILHQTGIITLGILAGELVHRLGLLYEECHHIKTRYKKRGGWWGAISAVFSNSHSQLAVVPLLVMIGISCILLGEEKNDSVLVKEEMNDRPLLVEIFPVVVVWCILRMIGAFDNSLEDMDILDSNNALLGPGLAVNYWFGFLKHMVGQSISEKLDEIMSLTEDYYEMMTHPSDDKKCPSRITDIKFNKLILLLPEDCNLEIKDEEKLKSENIYKHTEICNKGNTEVCDHTVDFNVEAAQRRDPIKQIVHWIYKSEEDEINHPEKIKDAPKIFLMFDFPHILQTAMGPGKGWEEIERPDARRKNLISFKRTVSSLLDCGDSSLMKKNIVFHMFKRNRDKKLSSELREKVKSSMEKENNKNDQNSSDSGSDYEV